MSGLVLARALLFAGECFAVSLVLPLLGFAVTALLRRAALRHLAWTTLFGVLAVLPIVALVLPARQVVQQAAAPVMIEPPVMMAAPGVAAPEFVPAPPPAASWGDVLTVENIVLFVVALWLAGLAWQVLRLGLGGIGLMRLRRRSEAFASEIETGCAVRLSHGDEGPSTFGILRPVVLLPRAAAAWPAARLEAVLRHEAAHVARRDVAAQFIARLVCGLYWINPLLWLGYRALRRDAEIAADDAVLAGGMTPSVYATELVRLAAENKGITPGIAMARPPLTKRVEAVLSDNVSRKGVSRMDMAKMGLLGLTATLLLGAARFDLATAQNAPAPKVERNADKDVAIEAKASVEAGAMKAESDRMAADAARALAHAEEARKAAQDVASTQVRRAMTRTGSPADAVAAARSLAAMEQAEKAARDVAMTQAGAAMRGGAQARQRAGAAMRDAAAARAADARQRQERLGPVAPIGDVGSIGDIEVQQRIMAKAEAVKAAADVAVANARAQAAAETDARTKEIFRRNAEEKAAEAAVTKADADITIALAKEREQAARARDKADPGKQQLMQLMSDSIATARQEMAKARARTEVDTRPVTGDVSRADRVTVGDTTFSGNVQMQQTKPGGPIIFNADRMTRDMGAPRYINRDGGVQVDAQVDAIPLGDAAKRRDVMDPLNAAITTAVAEARTKISAAIEAARAKAGLPPTPRSSVDFMIMNTGDLPVPPVPPAPPAARAIPAPPVPPRPLN